VTDSIHGLVLGDRRPVPAAPASGGAVLAWFVILSVLGPSGLSAQSGEPAPEAAAPAPSATPLAPATEAATATEATPRVTPEAMPEAATATGPAPSATPAPAPAPAATPDPDIDAASIQSAREEMEEDEEEDDWNDDDAEVDRSVHISGVLQASYRATFYTDDALPDGTAVDDDNRFQLEHTHIKLSGDQTQDLSYEIMPCLTHMNDFSIMTAFFDYAVATGLHIVAGRFMMPFGQFNMRSMPGVYNTVSRPLIYQSHEDRMIDFGQLTPSPILFTPRDDLGLQGYGSLWFGDSVQLSYTASITNGLRPESNSHARFWTDNNNAKQVVGRVSLGYHGDALGMSTGGSVLWNRYHEDLAQLAWGADAMFYYRYHSMRHIRLHTEYVRMDREIIADELLRQGDERTQGAYATLEVELVQWLSVVYGFDWLEETTPRVDGTAGASDADAGMTRHTAGGNFIVAEALHIRLEYGFWNQEPGLPDAHRLSAQTLVTF